MSVHPKSPATQLPRRPAAVLILFVLLFSLPAFLSQASAQAEDAEPARSIWLLGIDDVIGPATADYVERGIGDAADNNAPFVVLQINTPGGLDKAMRTIISAILASPIPVVTYVAPSGARAASAGTYILYASHIAAMAPATNLGAATPVQIGGMPELPGDREPPKNGGGQNDGEQNGSEQSGEGQATQPGSAMERKVVNDAVAYIQSLAELRGRNSEWAARAVREGVSLPARQARAKNVVEIVASDLDDLLQQLDGRSVTIQGETTRLQTEDLAVNRVQPDWRSKFLAVITNPNVAYILMLIGIYGLIFEFSNPGMGGPGIVGAISLLLALYAFQILPISYVGLGLIIVGLGLMAAEAFAPSFGVLGIGGAIAFVIGSIVLMDTDLPAYQIALPMILALAVASVALLVFVLGMVLKSTRQAVVSGIDSLVGETAVVEQVSRGQPLVRLQGELWQVNSSSPLSVGDRVVVRDINNLVLTVDKIAEE